MLKDSNSEIAGWRNEYRIALDSWHEDISKVQQHYKNVVAQSWQKLNMSRVIYHLLPKRW
jgi:hypothetical protein